MPWIVDKNSGIGVGKITARPGLIIRKNPGSEVSIEPVPNMPNYVVNAVEVYKDDMHDISGIFNTLKGDGATGVYTAQGILALQEAGQVRIRLKVKLMEEALAQLAMLWFSRMKQFWKDDRWLNITKQDGSYDMKVFNAKSLVYDYYIKVTAGSTMPVNRGAMLDLMIRLAQTPMPDGQMLVDREAVAAYLPEEVKSALLKRMKGENVQIQQLMQQVQQMEQQFQQFAQENQQKDDQTLQMVEEVAAAVEKLNKQILQLSDEYAKLEEERKKEEERIKLKTDSYNAGFLDAESLYSEGEGEDTPIATGDGKESTGTIEEQGLPDDMLRGLESLSDDELALVMQENPELVDLIK